MTSPILRFDRLTKRFPGVLALDGVGFSVERGAIHALVGENGAGKSTLGKILAGIYRPDGGRILLDDRPLILRDPRHALACGIGMVHQELAFCDNLTIAENLCLSDLPRRGPFLSRRLLNDRARAMLETIGVRLDVGRRIGDLSIAHQQMAQIAQAVAVGARIIIFDEPTSSLTVRETDRLFGLIGGLKFRGVTMIYISHRLEEIFRLADTVTVLRDGRHVATRPVAQTSEDGLVEQMIGRPLGEYFPAHLQGTPGREMLRVERLSSPGKFHEVSFTVRAGEIVGLAGLVGSGRSELAQAVFGLDKAARGTIAVDGRPLGTGSVPAAMRAGLALVPEDRKHQGLILPLSVRANFSITMLERFRRFGLIDARAERRAARDSFDRFDIRAPSVETPAEALSGGNQQKIVLAKWLARRSKVLLVDEPTRGVDVGAKAAIHALIDRLARDGLAILLISSELPEVLNLSTRLLVMRAGRLVGNLARDEATQDRVLRLMAGVAAQNAVA